MLRKFLLFVVLASLSNVASLGAGPPRPVDKLTAAEFVGKNPAALGELNERRAVQTISVAGTLGAADAPQALKLRSSCF